MFIFTHILMHTHTHTHPTIHIPICIHTHTHQPIGRELSREYALEMTFQEHHTSSCSQVPHSAVPVETTGDCKGTVLLKGHVVDGLGVTLLMQYLFTCNQVKQTPGVVEATGRERGAMVGRDVNCFQNDSIVF